MDADLLREVSRRATARLQAILAKTIRVLTVRPVKQWAREERRVAAGGPLAKGSDIAFDPSVMPHCEEPMDAVDDPDVNVLVLWMGRRMGKTENICANTIFRAVTDKPVNIISMWPVEDSRDRFSRDVIEKTIEATPALRRLFVEHGGPRETGRTIGFKRFAGGSLIINYAGSKSQTKGMAAGIVLAHEADAYPASSQGEGDPIEKLFGRAEGFADAIKIVESTGTIAATLRNDGTKEYHSNIEKWYDRSDQRKWFCPCRVCGEANWLKYEQIKQLPKKSGEIWFYICESCDNAHNEKQWRRMVQDGEWRSTAPFRNGIRGYWINGFCSLLPKGRGYTSKLHQFASDGQRALTGSKEDRRVWINEVKTELMPYSDDEVAPPEAQPIINGREDYATAERTVIPAKGLIVTNFTDIHGNRLEVEWRAWAKDEENWGLGHFVLDGDTNRPEVWEQWVQHLRRKWEHSSGMEMGMNFGLIDGGWRSDPISAVFRRLTNQPVPGVSGFLRASKGIGKSPAVIARSWATISNRLKGVHIGTWKAKELIYERLPWHKLPDRNIPCFFHFGKCYSEEFIRQCVVEKPVMKIIDGTEMLTFKNPEGTRNEGLDVLVGNLAAFRYRRWDFDTIERQIAEFIVAKNEAPEVAVEQPKPEPVPQGIVHLGGMRF